MSHNSDFRDHIPDVVDHTAILQKKKKKEYDRSRYIVRLAAAAALANAANAAAADAALESS